MNKEKNGVVMILWTIFLSISIVLRSKPTLFYGKTLIEYIIIGSLTIVSIFIFLITKKKILIQPFELLLIISPLFFIKNIESERYILFSIIGIVYYFVVQTNPKSFKYVKYPIIIFALLTSIASWIAVIKPQYYADNILRIFTEWTSLKYSFFNRGMNHGLTNHYSRNAFFITLGIICLFGELLTNKERKNSTIILLFFLFGTLFMVGKRGISLFILFSILIFILLKEKDLNKKVKKLFFFILVGVGSFTLAYFFVPSIGNVIDRTISMEKSDDVSNGRFYLYKIAIEMFKRKPLQGNGWGSFLEEVKGTTFQAVHNDYLQLLAEVGIIGTIVFLFFNFIVLSKSVVVLKLNSINDNQIRFIVYISLLYQIFFMLYSLTGYPHFSYEQILLYYMSSGAIIGVYKNEKRSNRNENN